MPEPLPAGGRVAVVGAINLDLVVAAPRLPSPGETVVGSGVRRHGGGKGANAALAAARAGAEVRFIGAVGEDEASEEVTADLLEAGVDLRALARLPNEATGQALIVVDPQGENQIAVGGGANLALDAAWVADAIASAAGALDCVLVSTEIPEATVLAAVAAATDAGIRCVLNPAPPVSAVTDSLAHHPLLTPNRGELSQLVGDARGQDVEAAARELSERSGAPVLVTLGAEGALLADAAGTQRLAAPPVEVQDATGAGDTFNGVLAAALAAGLSVEAGAGVAVLAASCSVGASGARRGMPQRDELLELIRRSER